MLVNRKATSGFGEALCELLIVACKNNLDQRLTKQLGQTNRRLEGEVRVLDLLTKPQKTAYHLLSNLTSNPDIRIFSTHFQPSDNAPKVPGFLVNISLNSGKASLVGHYFVPRLNTGLRIPRSGYIPVHSNLPHLAWVSGNIEPKESFTDLGIFLMFPDKHSQHLTHRPNGELPSLHWMQYLAMDPKKALENSLIACFPDEDVRNAAAVFLESFGKL